LEMDDLHQNGRWEQVKWKLQLQLMNIKII